MSKKRVTRCTKQFSYPNRDAAIGHREHLVQRNGGLRNINIYHCPQHDGWHVGRNTMRLGPTRRGRVKV